MPVNPNFNQPGVYYTPPNIVRLILDNTLQKLCEGRTDEDICNLKILDPSCGDGAFLVEACSFIFERIESQGNLTEIFKKRVIEDCIYGVDSDAEPLAKTRKRLQELVKDALTNLKHGDSLIGTEFPHSNLPIIDWHVDLPNIMERGGFDLVVGNPPWVSLSGRFGRDVYGKTHREYLRKRFGGSAYMPNMFEYFVSLGLELTRPEGFFSFIVPDRLGFNAQFSHLRNRILAETELENLIYGMTFPNVVADTLIFVCKKTAPSSASVTKVTEYQGSEEFVRQFDISDRFPKPSCNGLRRIVERMETLSGKLTLGNICDSTSGFGGKSSLITERKINDFQIPVLKGKSVGRYFVGKNLWFDFRKDNITGRTTNISKLGASPKILIRKTGDRITAALDDSGVFPEQSLYFLYNNRSKLDFRFILGVLNSKLMNAYYQTRCLTNRKTIAHVKKTDLDRIPLPPIDMSQPRDRNLHDQLVALADKMICATKNEIPRYEISAMDKAIDKLVCDLYQLSCDEIGIIESNP